MPSGVSVSFFTLRRVTFRNAKETDSKKWVDNKAKTHFRR
jgi:putative flippase GtrA